jgi:hypothetical protein
MLWVHPLTSNQISLDMSQEPLGIHLASEASGPLPPGRIAIADSVAQPPGTLPLAPKSSMYPIRPYPARRRAAADLGPIRHLPTDTRNRAGRDAGGGHVLGQVVRVEHVQDSRSSAL